MKFTITHASYTPTKDYPKEIEINSIEELLAFQQEIDYPLVLSPPWSIEKMDGGLIELGWELEIYDDYR